MRFLKFIKDYPRKLPTATGHQKTFKNLEIFLETPGASRQIPRKSSENIVLNDILDVFFKFSHAGACIVPAGGLEGLSFIGNMNVTLRADRLKSNYRTC